MSSAIDSPIIVLFEDRPKQGMVAELNLAIYLDARVVKADDLEGLKKAIAGPDGVHLVITRSQIRGEAFATKLRGFLDASMLKNIPVVSLGEDKDSAGIVAVNSETEVKPMLQAAAKLLGITAKQMVSKERPDTYQINAEFLKMLFHCPCDVFDCGKNGLEKLFSAGDKVPRAKVAKFALQRRPLVVESFQRLKLANAVTEQALQAAADLANGKLNDDRKMQILSASMDMVAAQFQSAGMDEETVKLANASIKAVEKIADSATNVGNLVKQLMEAQGGYRYAHCQLITFLGFHVIKMMGWWGDEQRRTVSQTAFYHDISLNTDEHSMVRTAKMVAEIAAKDPAANELLLTHAQLAARELQTSPDISPEVVRVVIQHHGSPVGRGFSTDIANLDNLTKTFVLSEEWCDYLMDLAQTGKPADNDGKIKALKGIYKDEQSRQIVETFRYLDPDAFASEILSAKEVDFAASLVSGGGAGDEAQSVVVPLGAEPETETVFEGNQAEEEVTRKIEGVTDHIEHEKITVKGQKEKTEPEKEARIKADNPGAGKPARVAPKSPAGSRAPRKAALADVAKLPSPAGEKARKLMAEIKARKPDATPEQVEKLLQVGGVTMTEETEQLVAAEDAAAIETEASQTIEGVTEHVVHEKITVKGEKAREEGSQTIGGVAGDAEQEEVTVMGERAPAVDLSRKIEGVTEHIEHEKITVKGENGAAEKSQKIEGVTDVRKDELVVIKGEKPQDLVDRSITRIKADPQEKDRELKMKALAGSTEFMKCALGGMVDKLAEILTASPVELRKTDAEGRAAIHYAAMGGAIPALKLLIEKGSSLNAVDSKRRSPLYMAALYKQTEAFDFLLGQGAKISQQAMGGMTIAMVGAFTGNLHILKTAVQKGVRLDSRDHSGKTALDYAKQSKQAETIAFIESVAKAPAPAPEKAAAAG